MLTEILEDEDEQQAVAVSFVFWQYYLYLEGVSAHGSKIEAGVGTQDG